MHNFEIKKIKVLENGHKNYIKTHNYYIHTYQNTIPARHAEGSVQPQHWFHLIVGQLQAYSHLLAPLTRIEHLSKFLEKNTITLPKSPTNCHENALKVK